MLMYAPLFSVESQYLGAEKTTTISFGPRVLHTRINPTSNASSVVLHFVTVHADFVAADDGFKAVVLTKHLGDVWAELHADTTLAGATARLVLGICPKHLHHEASLTGLALSMPVKFADIIQSDLVVREQTSVQHEVLSADQSRKRQSREALGEQLEDSVFVSKYTSYAT